MRSPSASVLAAAVVAIAVPIALLRSAPAGAERGAVDEVHAALAHLSHGRTSRGTDAAVVSSDAAEDAWRRALAFLRASLDCESSPDCHPASAP